VVRQAWHYAVVMLFLGISIGLPTTLLPSLQASAFEQPFAVAGAAMGFKGLLNTVLAPLAGALADRTGTHKGLLLGSLLLLVVPYSAILVASQAQGVGASSPAVLWTYTVADAVFGVYSVAMSLCFAAVPRVLRGDDRLLTSGYSLLNFALSSGVGAGALLGAMGDFSLCGRVGTVVSITNLVAACVLLPGSTLCGPAEHEHRSPRSDSEEEVRPGPEASVKVWALLRGNAALSIIAGVVFLDFLAEQMLVSLLLLYLSSRFHISSLQLSLQLLCVGGMASLSLLFVVPFLQPRIGDLKLMRLGLAVNAVSIALFAFVFQAWQAFLPPLGCLLSFAVFPTANTLAAAALPRAHGGVAQGIVSGSRTLAEGVSPVLFGWLFQVASDSALPGWPFLAAAGCVVVALVASFRLSEPATADRLLCRGVGATSLEMPL